MKNNNSVTAVEWLESQLTDYLKRIYKQEIEQAKEIEKQQHFNTWNISRIEDMGDNYIGKQLSYQEYYNETFNK